MQQDHPDSRNDNRSVRFETMPATDEPMKLVVKKTFIEVDDDPEVNDLSSMRRRVTAPAAPAFKFDGNDYIEEESIPPQSKRNLDVCNSEETETAEGSIDTSNNSSNASSWESNLDRTCPVDGEITRKRHSKGRSSFNSRSSINSTVTHLGEPGVYSRHYPVSGPPWMMEGMSDEQQTAVADAHATELELHAAELKLAALRAEAAAQRARADAPENRTRPNAQAQPFLPSGMPPSGMEGYPGMPGMFPPMASPFLTSTVPLWQYSSGDASTRHPSMPMHFDPCMFGQPPYGMPPMPPGNMTNYNPNKQQRAWEKYQRSQATEDQSKQRAPQPAAKADQDNTTVMLRNMPCDYTRDMLVEVLDAKGFAGKFDFLYVPFDFKKQAGLGYAFMNLTTHEDALRAMTELQGFSEWSVPTQKVMQVSWSTPLQGLAANIERYRNSPVMHPEVQEKFKPLLFKHGKSVRFPPPTKPLQKPEMRSLV